MSERVLTSERSVKNKVTYTNANQASGVLLVRLPSFRVYSRRSIGRGETLVGLLTLVLLRS